MTIFKLKDFDGPLDLLLTLIGKAKISISDIFVSDITDQYLDIVRNADDLDMDDATDFLVMAATLLEIKSRSLLPRNDKEQQEEADPEQELIRRLEEYKAVKETCLSLKSFEQAMQHVYTKFPEEYPLPPPEIDFTGLSVEGLTEAILRILSRKPEIDTDPESNHYAARNIHRDEHTVEHCMDLLRYSVKKKRKISFETVFSALPSREEVVTYFLALLELLKLGEIHAIQEQESGRIFLFRGRGKRNPEKDLLSFTEETDGKALTNNDQQ